MRNKLLLITLSMSTALAIPAFAAPLPAKTYGNVSTGLQPVLVSVKNKDITAKSQAFIEDVTSRGIGFLENSELSEEDRVKEFENILTHNFDMKTIARFALGRYWRTSTPAQKKEYLKLFEDMVVNVYSRRFSDYNGGKIEVISARPQGKADAIVSSRIIPNRGSAIKVDWRVRSKKGSLKIIDIMVEGVSMTLTQRSDFASVIQRGGGNIDVLLAHLRP